MKTTIKTTIKMVTLTVLAIMTLLSFTPSTKAEAATKHHIVAVRTDGNQTVDLETNHIGGYYLTGRDTQYYQSALTIDYNCATTGLEYRLTLAGADPKQVTWRVPPYIYGQSDYADSIMENGKLSAKESADIKYCKAHKFPNGVTYKNALKISKNGKLKMTKNVPGWGVAIATYKGKEYRCLIACNPYIKNPKYGDEKVVQSIFNKNQSDAEKVKAAYDYACVNVKYARNEGDFFGDKGINKANCGEFARGIEYLLINQNIWCTYVGYENANGECHDENVVRLDGANYWMDASSDCSMTNGEGKVYYGSFLLNDARHQHYTTDLVPCTSDKYSIDYFFGEEAYTDADVVAAVAKAKAEGKTELNLQIGIDAYDKEDIRAEAAGKLAGLCQRFEVLNRADGGACAVKLYF